MPEHSVEQPRGDVLFPELSAWPASLKGGSREAQEVPPLVANYNRCVTGNAKNAVSGQHAVPAGRVPASQQGVGVVAGARARRERLG